MKLASYCKLAPNPRKISGIGSPDIWFAIYGARPRKQATRKSWVDRSLSGDIRIYDIARFALFPSHLCAQVFVVSKCE